MGTRGCVAPFSLLLPELEIQQNKEIKIKISQNCQGKKDRLRIQGSLPPGERLSP